MSTITTRAGKGSPLTNTELDSNFTNLNDDKIESLVEDTTPQLGGDLSTNGNDINFGDNDKAVFGAGSDLQIYHDGSGTGSYITENGTGVLRLRSENGDGVGLYGASNAVMLFARNGAEVDLRYNGSPKLATTSTGINVTGTATMDGLTVDGADTEATTSQLLKVRNSTTGEAVTIGMYAKADNGGDGNTGSITFDAGADGSSANNELRFNADHQTDTNPALVIKGNGDISFYEDTGTTAKFFWDASAESLGIGTSSPSVDLHVKDANETNIRAEESTTGNYIQLYQQAGTSYLIAAKTGGSPTQSLAIYTGGSESARLDSSGNLLVGTTMVSNSGKVTIDAGASATGLYAVTDATAGYAASVFERSASDGDITVFKKGGSTVGSIGSNSSSTMQIGTRDININFRDDGANRIIPRTGAGGQSNGVIDLGDAGSRFKDLYLSGGVYLGGTGAANHLDDYESGTWTPASGTNSTVNSVSSAHYVKVGDLVHAYAYITSITTTSTSFVLTGLPFTCSGYGSGSLYYSNSGASDTFWHNTYVEQSTATAAITTSSTLAAKAIMVSFTYKAV